MRIATARTAWDGTATTTMAASATASASEPTGETASGSRTSGRYQAFCRVLTSSPSSSGSWTHSRGL
jgi:hypothetical protein